jgi:hypothetical protein
VQESKETKDNQGNWKILKDVTAIVVTRNNDEHGQQGNHVNEGEFLKFSLSIMIYSLISIKLINI